MRNDNFKFFFLALFLGACGGSSQSLSFPENETSSGATTSITVSGVVQELPIIDGQATLTAPSNESKLLVVYSTNEQNTPMQVELKANKVGTTSLLVDAEQLQPNETVLEDHDETEFHGFLREEEEFINAEVAPLPNTNFLVQELPVGAKRAFKVVQNMGGANSYLEVTGTLKIKTEFFDMYVDDRDLLSLTVADLQTLADTFLEVAQKERELFGEESDVNNDGKFNIFFTHAVNELSGSGSMVTGFFYAIDLFESNTYPASNQMEVIFAMVPDPKGLYGPPASKNFTMANILPGVLPHEYQHMINFNQRYFNGSRLAEQGWLNEALSHLAEDLYTLDEDGFLAGTDVENPSRVATYLNNVSRTCFVCGTGLAQRGGSYLFIKYLYEQADSGGFSGVNNGDEFIHKLLTGKSRGLNNVLEALNLSGARQPLIADLLLRFATALYVSDTGLASSSFDNFVGINLRALANDNRGTRLNGPEVFVVNSYPFVKSLVGNSMAFIELKPGLGTGSLNTPNSEIKAFIIE